MANTHDVRIWPKIQKNKLKRDRFSYTVRWRVAGEPFKKTCQTSALADSERSKLITAQRNGEAFDTETGRPVSEARLAEPMDWYEFACKYVDLKWPRAAATTRRSISDSLVSVTPSMFASDRGKPDAKVIRRSLHGWAFNAGRRDGERPDDVQAALAWVERSCKPVSAFERSDTLRAALDALASKLDGKPAAATTVARKRAVFSNALDYAVELGLLDRNPIGSIKWTAPKQAGGAVDPRTVVNPSQARTLLAAVGEMPGSGPRMVAFFAVMYFSALRPGEAVNLRRSQLVLPKSGWGELLLEQSSPYAGASWTDDGEDRDRRQLKHRAVGEVRPVPCPPALTAILHEHLEEHGTDPDGRLFWAARGGDLPAVTYQTMWKKVRKRAFGKEMAKSSQLARRPYDLRHAAVSTWLASGVEAPRVALWAGHSVDVLLRVYAKFLDGQEEVARQRIEAALGA
ncbi:tyrosine-type recombinase/integrase [Kribbella sancticallisti]|uniref:Tyrosine-type recombinase/integrase n=1 Tax=Kribbella sancticallisti TaxID=460087 RepID=A0ABP4NJ22_9ACTN